MSTGVRDGATVLLARDGHHPDRPLEVLMLRRHPATAFGSIWAFPGGAVDPDDALPLGCPLDEAEASRRLGLADGGGRFWACAAREAVEETGLPVRPDDLHYLSHWITPEGAATRFDTRFFVARAPEGEHVHDEREHIDSCWIRPADALARSEAGDFDLILPTQRTLEVVGRFADVAELLAAVAEGGDPRAIDDGGGWRVRLPGDPEAVEA
jgi:8-oxo-dGTP pyrophosphatase MutT (NUDIX family)